MSLNFNSTKVTEQMYTIAIEGHTWSLNEANTQKIIDILNGMSAVSSKPSKPVSSSELHMAPERKSDKPLPDGVRLWQENFVTVIRTDDGEVRVYVSCPIAGDKGKYIRDRIKAEFKGFGARWAGNIETGDIFWSFPDEQSAKKYIAARKKAAKERA